MNYFTQIETRRYRLETAVDGECSFARIIRLRDHGFVMFYGPEAVDVVQSIEEIEKQYGDHEEFEQFFNWAAGQYDMIMEVLQ